MASLVLFGILGLGMGVGYTLVLRQLTERLVSRSSPAISLVISMATVRLVPIGLLVAAAVFWGMGLTLAAFGGFWLGRTAILALSFSRRLG